MSVDGQFGHLFHAPIMQVPRTRLYELFRPEWTVSQLARMEWMDHNATYLSYSTEQFVISAARQQPVTERLWTETDGTSLNATMNITRRRCSIFCNFYAIKRLTYLITFTVLLRTGNGLSYTIQSGILTFSENRYG